MTTEPTPYDRLTALVAAALTDTLDRPPGDYDDAEFSAYLWASLYDYGDGTIPEPDTITEITNVGLESPEGWGSLRVAVLGRLADDRWFSCVGWCDTSGFGCRQQVDWYIGRDRGETIAFGLDREARAWLGLALASEQPEAGRG